MTARHVGAESPRDDIRGGQPTDMGDHMNTCRCGAPVHIKWSGECARCYNRRYGRLRRARAPKTVHAPSTAACTYDTAHHRVARRRGSASDHQCVECGREACEWSYRGGAPTEQRGTRKRQRRGKTYVLAAVWCGDPSYYDPMCRECHAARDGHQYRTGYRHDPAKLDAFRAREAAKKVEARRTARRGLPAW